MTIVEASEHPPDVEQILAVAHGDRVVFGRVYDRYYRSVYSLALAILRSQAEAEDLLQEIMVKIWTKAPSYNVRRGSPLNWIMTMTRNSAIDRIRKGKRSSALEEPLLDDDSLPSDLGDAHQSATESETRKMVQSSLLKLPTDQRQAIEMAYFGGLTHTEIANTLEQPVGTIKARIRRGMQKLNSDLKGII